MRAVVVLAGVLVLAVGPSLQAQKSSTTLAGFGIKAYATGLDIFYDSPSAPVPLSPSPTAELAFGYSLATLDAGPIGHALASVLWPGAFIANIPPLVDPSLPKYPVRAEAFSPQGPAKSQNTPASGSDMQAAADGLLAEAASHAASAGVPALAAVSSAASTSRSAIEKDRAVGYSTATASGVSIGGGAVVADSVNAFARITTDGGKPKIEGKTVVSGLSIGGTPAVVDEKGVHAAGADNDATSVVDQQLLRALDVAGLTLRVASPVDAIKGASGSRIAAGLLVTLTPAAVRAAIASLPSDLAAQVGSTVVLDQTVTIALGGVSVASASSPGFKPPIVITEPPVITNPPVITDPLAPPTTPSIDPTGGSGSGIAPNTAARTGLGGGGELGVGSRRAVTTRRASSRLSGGYPGLAPVWVALAIAAAIYLGLRIRSLADTLLFGPEEEE